MGSLVADHSKLSKLPKWARDYIVKIENDKARLEKQLEARSVPDAHILADPFSATPTGFLERTIVRFRFNVGSGKRESYVDASIRGGKLYINASDQIAFAPVAANAGSIYLLES